MKGMFLVVALIAPIVLSAQATPLLTSLRIVDAQGVEAVVAKAIIDYGGMVTSDMQTDGIRLNQGDGAVFAKWSVVDTIRVTGVDESTRPATLRLQVVLRNGTRRPATLFEKGRMQLLGETDLGEYSLDLHKVRLIVPAR
jgi:hypothetical protein